MRPWHDVAAVAEVEAAGRIVVRIDGREIGVVHERPGGALRAIRNRCPHQGAPICLGTVRTRGVGSPGRYELGDRRVLRCPWHGWEFDLETGNCLDDGSMRIATYPVRIEHGRVLVQV